MKALVAGFSSLKPAFCLSKYFPINRKDDPMNTRTHRLTLAAALAALSGPAALPATEYRVSDFLPLAVGNSWTCFHQVRDPYGLVDAPGPWTAWKESGGAFTLTVERTEVIEGKTYYVLSDLPSGGWPPSPLPPPLPGFIAGKKLRWEGSRLMERAGTGEQTLYDFDMPEVFERDEVPKKTFSYPAPDLEERLRTDGGVVGSGDEPNNGSRSIEFLATFGVRRAHEGVALADAGALRNEIGAWEAALIESAEGTGVRGDSGESEVVRKRNYYQARRGEPGTITPLTAVSRSSWGQVKESEAR